MRRARVVLAAVVSLVAVAAGPAAARERGEIEGDGNPTTQRRDAPPFDAIDLEGASDVSVRVGGERTLSVTIDGNLQPHLQTEVRGGTLVIRTDERLHPRTNARVEISV